VAGNVGFEVVEDVQVGYWAMCVQLETLEGVRVIV
jgi:hypothetical protein